MPFLSLTFADAYQRETTKRIELKTQADLAGYTAAANAVFNALATITDLVAVRADLVIGNFLPLAGSAVPPANVDVGGTFQAELAGEANRKASHKVPGIKAAYVGAQGTIDVANVDIAAYLANYLDAGECLLSDGESVGSWLKGTLDR
jgi:hypothetical protein